MLYRKIEGTDVSEIALECPSPSKVTEEEYTALVEKSLAKGVNFFRALEPEETAVLGDILAKKGARRNAVVACGIPEFFAAFSRHRMTVADFLEHELSDRLSRLKSSYVDLFVIDLGAGRSVDFEQVLAEDIPTGEDAAAGSYEGGVFLHETIAECMSVIDRFKTQGRVRLSGIGGENVAVLERVLVKSQRADVVCAPYNFAFRAAADQLIPIAAETDTAVVATRPLWWGIRAIPVTVLVESPFPPDRIKIEAKIAAIEKAAYKWPLSESGVASVVAEASSPDVIEKIVGASTDTHWTREDEEMLEALAETAKAQDGIFMILSAMNSPDSDIRAQGWASYIRRGLPESHYDPFAGDEERKAALSAAAALVVRDEVTLNADDLDEPL